MFAIWNRGSAPSCFIAQAAAWLSLRMALALASDLSRAFDLLAAAVDRFDTKSKALVVASDVSFAALWLVPRLKRFLAGHPDVDIIVDPDPRLTDYAKGEADIGIRYGRGPWKDIASEKLFDAKSSPVCAPRILETSAVKAPADLVGQPLIREDRYDAWPAWFHAAGVTPTDALSGPQVRGELAIAAAEAGAGFALADTVQAGDALMSGRLVRPFEATVEEFSYFLVHAEGARLSKTAQAFAMWLKGECNRFADEFSEWQARTSGQPAGHAPKAKAAFARLANLIQRIERQRKARPACAGRAFLFAVDHSIFCLVRYLAHLRAHFAIIEGQFDRRVGDVADRIELVASDQLAVDLLQNNEACFLAAIGIATGFIQVEQDFLVEAEGAGVRRKCDVGTRLRLEAIDDPACFSGEFFMLITHHRGAMQENVGDGIDPTEGIVGRLAGAAARARNDLIHLDLDDAEPLLMSLASSTPCSVRQTARLNEDCEPSMLSCNSTISKPVTSSHFSRWA